MSAAPARAEPMLALRDLTLGYDRHPAVHHLEAAIARGDLVALVGPNGAGKSTLLKGIVGEARPLGGRIERFGLDARAIAYLPQAAEIDRTFPIRVLDLVASGLWGRLGSWRGLGRAGTRAVEGALEAVGLGGFERRLIGSLSGGQMRRALFARVLLQDAALILLDEPFSAVDARTTGALLALVARWHGEGRTIVAALHDLDQVRRHFPKTLLLARELVAYGPTAAALGEANLDRARRLCEAWDEDAELCHRGAHAAQAGLRHGRGAPA